MEHIESIVLVFVAVDKGANTDWPQRIGSVFSQAVSDKAV